MTSDGYSPFDAERLGAFPTDQTRVWPANAGLAPSTTSPADGVPPAWRGVGGGLDIMSREERGGVYKTRSRTQAGLTLAGVITGFAMLLAACGLLVANWILGYFGL